MRARPAVPHVLVLTALVCAAYPVPLATAADSWEAIEHLSGQTPVTVNVSGNSRLYYRITHERPLTVPLEGPTRLRVTSRVEFANKQGAMVSYTLRVYEGTRELEHEQTETSPSSVVSHGEGAVGKSRRMTVDLPAGHHELRIVAEGVLAVLVRLHESAPQRGEERTVSLTPVNAWRSVLVAEGEKTIPYYSVAPGRPIQVHVVGPTALHVIARLDFDDSMRGTRAYRLVFSADGHRLREVEFKTSKATTASYQNLRDRVPSKFDRLVLPIAKGTHEIQIELLAPVGGTAEVHLRIPQPDVGSQE